MYLGERYQIQDSNGHSRLRIPNGQQPAQPLFPGAIGVGKMAVVYRGIDTHTGQAVALKLLHDSYATDPKFITRFQRQARITSKLQHPNIVQVYDYGQFNGHYYMVMELVGGSGLRGYIPPPLDPERATLMAYHLALGLGAAHDSGTVHGNMNVQNVLIGPSRAIKLTGFCGMSADSESYYAPEQVQGDAPTPATDVYGLGTLLYEMVAGWLPFNSGDTPADVIMQRLYKMPPPPSKPTPPSQSYLKIPPALEEIIMCCLETSPEQRYRNGSELARALQDL